MKKITILLLGHNAPFFPTHVASASMSINGVEYLYKEFNYPKFLTIIGKNWHKPGQTLKWLKKNAKAVDKLKLVLRHRKEDTTMCSQQRERAESWIRHKNRQERRKEMIRKAREWFATHREGCTPVDAGKGTKCDKCVCGKSSMIRYYTPDKTGIIRLCIRRFDSREDRRCNNSDKVPVSYGQYVKKAKKKEPTTKNATSNAV